MGGVNECRRHGRGRRFGEVDMRLEVGSFHINSIEYGVRTGVDGGTLVVNGEEVRRLVLGDSHFADVRVHLARPGETIRIINAKSP